MGLQVSSYVSCSLVTLIHDGFHSFRDFEGALSFAFSIKASRGIEIGTHRGIGVATNRYFSDVLTKGKVRSIVSRDFVFLEKSFDLAMHTDKRSVLRYMKDAYSIAHGVQRYGVMFSVRRRQ